jgi:biotin carboxyl carrier protein
MKSFHHITAGATGTIVEFLVENEDEVDAGQPVAVVETP